MIVCSFSRLWIIIKKLGFVRVGIFSNKSLKDWNNRNLPRLCIIYCRFTLPLGICVTGPEKNYLIPFHFIITMKTSASIINPSSSHFPATITHINRKPNRRSIILNVLPTQKVASATPMLIKPKINWNLIVVLCSSVSFTGSDIIKELLSDILKV